ncbi:hypothetical protein KAR91_03585 [Candidatus Pacearchaeota archaeon]|nr:hypothetical protein [Candidatus Pacearchaeota archaeon]
MSEANRTIRDLEEQLGKHENRIRILEEKHRANYAFTSGLLMGWISALRGLKLEYEPDEFLRVLTDMAEHSNKLARLGGLKIDN